MKPLYVTLTVRALVNAEALNMAESVGNLVRRKRLPIIVSGENGLEVRLYPVVSGQSLAHAYQEILARRARGKGLPVCKLCEQGVFVKHSDDGTLERLRDLGDTVAANLLSLVRRVKGSKSVKIKDALSFYSDFEENVVASCVVEDVGGFLYTGKVPVRRTSRVKFSYMIPSLQAPHAVGVESVVHTRNDPAALGEGGGQAIYNVEMSSALYTFSVLLDVSGIGVVRRLDSGEERPMPDRVRRIETALESLAELVLPASFGAKHSRFLPHWEIESIAAAVVEGFRYQLPGGHRRSYIVDAVKRLEAAKRLLGGDYRLVYYVREPPSGEKLTDEPEGGERVVRAETPEEVFERIREWVMGAVGSASGSSGGG